MILVMPCDAEMYCDDLKWINDVSMLDSGSSLYYIKPNVCIHDIVIINDIRGRHCYATHQQPITELTGTR